MDEAFCGNREPISMARLSHGFVVLTYARILYLRVARIRVECEPKSETTSRISIHPQYATFIRCQVLHKDSIRPYEWDPSILRPTLLGQERRVLRAKESAGIAYGRRLARLFATEM
jgi:hypothetical protein